MTKKHNLRGAGKTGSNYIPLSEKPEYKPLSIVHNDSESSNDNVSVQNPPIFKKAPHKIKPASSKKQEKKRLNALMARKVKALEAQVNMPPLTVAFNKTAHMLVDECCAKKTAVFLNKHFASAHHVEKIIGSGVKDPGVVTMAMQRGVGTIFTKDSTMKSDQDICKILTDIFNKPELAAIKYGVEIEFPTTAILVPSLKSREMKTLILNHQYEIAAHITNPVGPILDLRY